MHLVYKKKKKKKACRSLSSFKLIGVHVQLQIKCKSSDIFCKYTLRLAQKLHRFCERNIYHMEIMYHPSWAME